MRRQNKRANLGAAKGLLLSNAIADAFVSRNHDPFIFAGGSQPFNVGSILREMVVVDKNVKTGCAKNCRDLVPAKLPVEKERQLLTRLLRG